MRIKKLFILLPILVFFSCKKDMIIFPAQETQQTTPEETPQTTPQETPISQKPDIALLWHLENVPLKAESTPIPYLFFNIANYKLLAAVMDLRLGSIGFYEGGKAGMPLVDSVTPTTPSYLHSLPTLVMSRGNVFGIAEYNHDPTFESEPDFPEAFQMTVGLNNKTLIPLPPLWVTPQPLPLFVSDMRQNNMYALSFSSDTVDTPNFDYLWKWNNSSDGWLLPPLLWLSNLPGPLIQPPPFIASGDPNADFICLAYEEQNVTCSQNGGEEWETSYFVTGPSGAKIVSFAYNTWYGIVFIGDDSGKIFASTNLVNWEVWGTGSLGEGVTKELLSLPASNLLLALTNKSQIYSSTDGGPWILVADALTDKAGQTIFDISHLVYDRTDKSLYAVISYSDTTSVPDPSNPFPWHTIGSFSFSYEANEID